MNRQDAKVATAKDAKDAKDAKGGEVAKVNDGQLIAAAVGAMPIPLRVF